MKPSLPFFFAAVCAFFFSSSSLHADPFSKVLFEDDFSGAELGEKWGSWKSETIVRDGVMVGITPKEADHPSVNTIELPPLSDMEVAVSFKFNGSNRFNVMFRDLAYKGSHASHICHVSVSDQGVTIFDGKTGIFAREFYDKKKAGGKYTDDEKERLEKTKAVFKFEIDPEKWHDLRIRLEGDIAKVWIDSEVVATLKSAGIAHSSKSNMNLTTIDREVLYDDFSIHTP